MAEIGTRIGFLARRIASLPLRTRRRPGATIHLQQDRSASCMVCFFGAIVVGLVAELFLGRFARSVSVRGYVSAASGLTRLDARTAGIVRFIDLRQDDRVTRGQRLM